MGVIALHKQQTALPVRRRVQVHYHTGGYIPLYTLPDLHDVTNAANGAYCRSAWIHMGTRRWGKANHAGRRWCLARAAQTVRIRVLRRAAPKTLTCLPTGSQMRSASGQSAALLGALLVACQVSSGLWTSALHPCLCCERQRAARRTRPSAAPHGESQGTSAHIIAHGGVAQARPLTTRVALLRPERSRAAANAGFKPHACFPRTCAAQDRAWPVRGTKASAARRWCCHLRRSRWAWREVRCSSAGRGAAGHMRCGLRGA